MQTEPLWHWSRQLFVDTENTEQPVDPGPQQRLGHWRCIDLAVTTLVSPRRRGDTSLNHREE